MMAAEADEVRFSKSGRTVGKVLVVFASLWFIYEYIVPAMPTIMLNDISLRTVSRIAIPVLAFWLLMGTSRSFRDFVYEGSIRLAAKRRMARPRVVRCIGYGLVITLDFWMLSIIVGDISYFIRMTETTLRTVNILLSLTAVIAVAYMVNRTLLGRRPVAPLPTARPERPPQSKVKELEQMLEKLDERLAAGGVSEEIYKELKSKYEERAAEAKQKEQEKLGELREQLENYDKEKEILEARHDIGDIGEAAYREQRTAIEARITQTKKSMEMLKEVREYDES